MRAPESPTAYVVTRGEYSDYTVLGVWTDRTRAEKYVAAHNSQSNRDPAKVEEFPLNAEKERWSWTCVRMHKNGDVEEVYTQQFATYTEPRVAKYSGILHVWVNTDNHEKAVKIANEVRGQMIAENRWQ